MKHDDQDRRDFWILQMEQGYDFMESILNYPVDECFEPLLPLREAVNVAGVEVVFSDSQIVPGLDRKYYLRSGLIEIFINAAREMNARGMVIKVEDAYRDRQMQKELALKQGVFDKVVNLIIWEQRGKNPSQSSLSRRLRVLIAHCAKTGTHMSGSAIDISLIHRDGGSELDRGAPYLELSELTPMSSPFVSKQCRRNRELINSIMRESGFIEYPYEFWHYSSGDAYFEYLFETGKPGRYGPVDVDISSGEVTPNENPTQPLNNDTEIQVRIEQAMQRVKKQ